MAERLKLLAPPTIRAFFGGGLCGHHILASPRRWLPVWRPAGSMWFRSFETF